MVKYQEGFRGKKGLFFQVGKELPFIGKKIHILLATVSEWREVKRYDFRKLSGFSL
jgi:hypothetical protein